MACKAKEVGKVARRGYPFIDYWKGSTLRHTGCRCRSRRVSVETQKLRLSQGMGN